MRKRHFFGATVTTQGLKLRPPFGWISLARTRGVNKPWLDIKIKEVVGKVENKIDINNPNHKSRANDHRSKLQLQDDGQGKI